MDEFAVPEFFHIAGQGWILSRMDLGCFCGLLIVVGLEIEPHFGGPAEVAFEAQGGVHGEGAFAFYDLVDAAGRDADVFGDAVFRKAKGDEEILAENLSGMNGSVCFHVGFSQVSLRSLQ